MATEAKPHQAGGTGSLAKDFHRLMKNIDSFSGGQARVADWNESNLEDGITVAVVPDSGPYKDGEFMFLISFEDKYPEYAPYVYCRTPIYHPNICLLGGDICLNMLDDDYWSSSMNLEDVVQGILFLMHNPNLEDGMNSINSLSMDEEEFAKNVKQSLDGGYVGRHRFERNRITRGEDGEIAKDDNSTEDGGAACREEQLSKTAGQEENAKPADAAAENKTTDEPKKAGSGEKGAGETEVIGLGRGI